MVLAVDYCGCLCLVCGWFCLWLCGGVTVVVTSLVLGAGDCLGC